MKKHNNNSVLGIITVIPLGFSLISAHICSLWLAAATIILVFILVGVLPFCHRRENLWLFVMTAIVSVPINWFLLREYELWMFLSPAKNTSGWVYYMSLAEYVLVLSSFEEILSGMIGRIIWPKQIRLYIPYDEEDE